MVIMGNNGRGNFEGGKVYFLSATGDEIANLMGYKYASSGEVEKMIGKSGVTIPISDMYNKLYRMANLENELMKVSAELKAASEFINTALPTIKHVNESEG